MSYHYKKIKVNGKCIDEHRHIMQLHLGRNLKRSEIVHHKDGNKLNNDISNLEIMSLSDHTKLHFQKGDLFGDTHVKWSFEKRKHPSLQMYKEGCRCSGCKDLQNERMKIYRENKKQKQHSYELA